MTLGRRELLGALLLTLTACGSKAPGGGGGNPPPDGGSAGTPTAAFAAPTTVVAGTPALFDATASHAADGSALSYFWEFGGGRRGAGRSIAQVFDDVGSRQVSLTVVDAQGRSARTQKAIDVTPGPAPAATVNALGRVYDLDGHPLAGVTVAPGGGAASAITDGLGEAHVQVPAGAPVAIRLSKDGFADQFVRLELPASTGADADFEATLRPRDVPRTLVDAAAGGSLDGRDGARITLPAGAFVDGTGAPVSGAVDLSLTPVDVTGPHAGGFPGRFEGLGPDAARSPIVSFGTTEFVPTSGGQRLQLAVGKAAEVELPLYANTNLDGTAVAAGQVFPLWSLDESTGVWVQEGQGTVVASTASPTGFAMHATVSHLSWWNCDIGFGNGFGPKPHCIYDTDIGLPGAEAQFATATICNMLGDIDRGLGGGALRSPWTRSAAASTPGRTLPGYAAKTTIPIEGGVALPVPAGIPIRLTASALNGTWTGETVVSGAEGEQREVPIKMRPIAGAGQGQLVTPPVDLTAALQGGDVARYDFLGTGGQFAQITVSHAQNSTLQGTVRLLLGAVEVAAAPFGSSQAQITHDLPADGRYTVEITPTANTPGAFRFQLVLLGGIQTSSVTLPFDVQVNVPAYTTSRQIFDLSAGQALLFGFLPEGGGAITWRVRPENGGALAQGVVHFQEGHAVGVGGPGRYWLETETAQGLAFQARITGERTFWAPVTTGPVVADTSELVDLIADHDGAPVIVRAVRSLISGVWNETVSLLRWNGAALGPVGPDLVYPNPCGGSGFLPIDVAFDASNRPYVLFADTVDTPSGAGRFNLRRLASGAWEAVGPGGGALPNQSARQTGCFSRPAIRLRSDGTPLVAYLSDTVLWVQQLQGNAWVGPVSASGDSFPAPAAQYDLQLDSAGRPLLVWAAQDGTNSAHAVRLSATPSWNPVGPNGGVLPLPANIGGLQYPHLRLDESGSPVVGFQASVATGGGAFGSGVSVARFDGVNWQVGSGFFAPPDGSVRAPWDLGFALFGSDAVMGWRTLLTQSGSLHDLVLVERNTPSGWSGLGAADGVVSQFAARGLLQETAYSQRLLFTGGTLYLALIRHSTMNIELIRYAP